MSHLYKLPLCLEPQPEGVYNVTSPVLPGLITQAETSGRRLRMYAMPLRPCWKVARIQAVRYLGGSSRARANSVSTSNLPSVCHDLPRGNQQASTVGLRGAAAPLWQLAPDLA